MSDFDFCVVVRLVAFACDVILGLAIVGAFFEARWRVG
tara:strand:+ start:1159 stop:1272 length:114 start_codon:yes stop_codon:yes gene_type:complete